MTLRRALVAALDDLSLAGVAQRSLRVVMLLAAVAAWLAGGTVGADESPLTFSLLLLGAAWTAVTPDTNAGLLVPLAVGWQWLAHVDRTTGGPALAAALALLVFHSAASLAASAPVVAPIGGRLVLAALRRAGVLAALTVAVWGAVRAEPLRGDAHLSLTIAALLVLSALAYAATRLVRPRAG